MMESLVATYAPLLETVSFTARVHAGQFRKDRQTPYASHPFRVCLITRHIFGCEDPVVLMTALLHDTLEDTETTPAQIGALLPNGATLAAWVADLTKEMQLPHSEREALYLGALARAPWPVRLCKLADIFDNMLDSRSLSRDAFEKQLRRSHSYLTVLRSPSTDAPPLYPRAVNLVVQLLQEVETQRNKP